MLAKDLVRPIGMPLEEVKDPPVHKDHLDEFYLRKDTFGGHPVGFKRSTQTLKIGGEDWTPAKWIDFRGRVDTIMVHEGLVQKGPEPTKVRSSNFLGANVEEIIACQRGRMKRAPWWLRWLYDQIVTKEPLNG